MQLHHIPDLRRDAPAADHCADWATEVVICPSAYEGKVPLGLELVRASGLTEAFCLPPHDCDVVGMTDWGVQSFAYPGMQRPARSGDALIIRPDAPHDRGSSIEEATTYRAVYSLTSGERIGLRRQAQLTASKFLPNTTPAVSPEQRDELGYRTGAR